MMIGHTIRRLRTKAKLSQEQFADLFDVSQQSVQKWESGNNTPDLDKLINISKHFGVSLDALILNNDNRIVEEMKNTAYPFRDMPCFSFMSTNAVLRMP